MKSFDEIYNEVLLGKREPTTREDLFYLLSSKGNIKRDILADTFIYKKYDRSKRVCHVKDVIKPPTASICKKLLNSPDKFSFSTIVRHYSYRQEPIDTIMVADNDTKLCISLQVSFPYNKITPLSGDARNTFERELRVGFMVGGDICSEKAEALSSMFNKYEKDLLALTLYELFKEKKVQEEKEREIAEREEQKRKKSYEDSLRKELVEQYKGY